MQTNQLGNAWALFIGLFLFTSGLWGLFSQSVFEILTTNTLHAMIDIIIGIAGLYYWSKADTRSFNIIVGIFLLLIGVLRFVNGADRFVIDILNVNYAAAYVNIVAGSLGFIIGLLSPKLKPRHNVAVLF